MTDSSCSNKYAHSFYRYEQRNNKIVTVKVSINSGVTAEDFCVKCGKLRDEIFPSKHTLSIINLLTPILPQILGSRLSIQKIQETFNLPLKKTTIKTYLNRMGYKKHNKKWIKQENTTIQQHNNNTNNLKHAHTRTHAHTPTQNNNSNITCRDNYRQ